jgi:hypothetical protein
MSSQSIGICGPVGSRPCFYILFVLPPNNFFFFISHINKEFTIALTVFQLWP